MSWQIKTNLKPEVANVLRRVVLKEIQGVGVDKVIIRENSSCVPNEIVAHRLGFLSCVKAQGNEELSLDVLNDAHRTRTVTVDDVICPETVKLYNPFPAHPAVLGILQPGERLSLTLALTRDSGSRHCRFVRVRRFFHRSTPTGCLIVVEGCGGSCAKSIFRQACAHLCQQLRQVQCGLTKHRATAASPSKPCKTSSSPSDSPCKSATPMKSC
jgi:hypothetical protein